MLCSLLASFAQRSSSSKSWWALSSATELFLATPPRCAIRLGQGQFNESNPVAVFSTLWLVSILWVGPWVSVYYVDARKHFTKCLTRAAPQPWRPGHSFLSSVGDMTLNSNTMQSIWVLMYCEKAHLVLPGNATDKSEANKAHLFFKMAARFMVVKEINDSI